MLPTKGLYTDSSLIDQPPQTHRDARNIVFSRLYGSIINEPGFEKTAFGYPNTLARPIGISMFPDNSYVIYSDGINGGLDRLGFVDVNEQYSDIIVDNILNFDINFPVRASEIDYNFLNQKIVAWTDANNTPRVVNIQNLPFALNPDKSLVNPSEIIELETFASFLLPDFNLVNVVDGGSLPVGNYSFFGAYLNQSDGTQTPYSIVQLNVNIATLFGNANYGSSVPGIVSSKAIQLSIGNIDTRYDTFVLGAISSINGIVSAYKIKEIPIGSSTTINVTYSGTEAISTLTLDEVLTTKPLYKTSKALTQLNNTLYHANLVAFPEINYQTYANQIKIYYTTKLVDISDSAGIYKKNISPGFTHGGVYAFYIRLLLKNGSYSRAFHIPGRTSYGGSQSGASSPLQNSTIASQMGYSALAYQVEDTTNQGGHSYITGVDGVTRVSSMNSNTNMGFWQNQDEQYLPNFPDLAGQNVRHHVFPTIRTCHNKHYSSNANYGKTQLDILGVDVSNIQIPNDIRDQVVGYQIMYARRDFVNSNTFGTDLLLFAAKYDNNPNIIHSAGGNWTINTGNSNSDFPVGSGDLVMRNDYIRGHSFELLRDKPTLGGQLYADPEIGLNSGDLTPILNYGNALSLTVNGGNMVQSGANEGRRPGARVSYLPQSVTTTLLPFNNSAYYPSALSQFRYLPSGIKDGEIVTVKNEEAVHFKITTGGTKFPLANKPTLNVSTRTEDNHLLFRNDRNDNNECSYLFTYRQIKTNLFLGFDSQVLCACNQVAVPDSFGNFPSILSDNYGGDSYIGLRSFLSTSPYHAFDVTSNTGVCIVRAHICESRYNMEMKYEISGNVTTKFYPEINPFEFWTNPTAPNSSSVDFIFNIMTNPNSTLGYSSDSNAQNSYNQGVIFNPNQVYTSNFPFRIIRSGFANTNRQQINSWKTYLVGDIYEANRNRGEIINLATMDDVLLIHHKYALFRTVGKDVIQLTATEVSLGQQDIFSQNPKDQIPSRVGMLGTQNIFSCLSFKGGYAWVNQQDGTAYLITANSFDEISDNGQRIFFYENTKIDNTLPDNPFLNQGITMGYDKLNNRLLFTKNGNNPFTISYSLDYKFWACFHDYAPSYYFFNNYRMYAIKTDNISGGDNNIMICDSPTKKGMYFGNTIYPSYITIVANDEPKVDKIFYNVDWISELFDVNNVLVRQQTLTSIQGKTSFQDTTEIPLIPFTKFGNKYNTRAVINQWRFNALKNSSTDPFKSRPLRDKYSTITLKYDNHTDLNGNQNSLYLYDFSVGMRKAEL